jgi:hypothetical protein
VGVHNGQCYVQDPLVLYLTAEQEDSGMSSLSRKLSFKQTQRRRTVSAERFEILPSLFLLITFIKIKILVVPSE